MTQELDKRFVGGGDMSGAKFIQIEASQHAYIYEVLHVDVEKPIFEVFTRKASAVCIDFEKRLYSDTEFKVIYPKSNAFGVWAWSFSSELNARKKFDELNQL